VPETPEDRARREIDADLIAAAWLVQDRDDIDLTAGRGVAVRGFPMKPGFGFADYLLYLYLDRKAAGAVEAKAHGTLSGVEPQSAKYAAGLPDNLPAHRRPLPFLFEANGSMTYFTNGLDPTPRSRQVFGFPRPETLAAWLAHPTQLRARLKALPELDASRLWTVQARAIANLEKSFANADQRALKQKPIQSSDFHELFECCKPGREHERAETWSEADPEGRWRCYEYEDLLKGDKLSLDLFWIKDKSLTDTDSLPAPAIIAAEIADDLEAAMEQFTKIAARLK
jgi:hypothetical protein